MLAPFFSVLKVNPVIYFPYLAYLSFLGGKLGNAGPESHVNFIIPSLSAIKGKSTIKS